MPKSLLKIKKAQKIINLWARYLCNEFEVKNEFPKLKFEYTVHKGIISIKSYDAGGVYCSEDNIIIVPPATYDNTESYEYPSYGKDSVIGSIIAGPITVCLSAISHELSHWFQIKVCKSKGIYKDIHGKGFQFIYRILRNKYINNREDVKLVGGEASSLIFADSIIKPENLYKPDWE